jgi:hypothetical protein
MGNKLRDIHVEPADNGHAVVAHHEPDADDQKNMMLDHSAMTERTLHEGPDAPEKAGARVTELLRAHDKAKGKKGHPAMAMKGRPQAPASTWAKGDSY